MYTRLLVHAILSPAYPKGCVFVLKSIIILYNIICSKPFTTFFVSCDYIICDCDICDYPVRSIISLLYFVIYITITYDVISFYFFIFKSAIYYTERIGRPW